MNVPDSLDLALRGLRTHRQRSVLTMLGLMVGVASVIVLSALSHGVENAVSNAVEPIANSIIITPKVAPTTASPPSEPLTDSDERAVARLPGVRETVPVVTGSTTESSGQVDRAVTATTYRGQYLSATVTGTTAGYLSTSQKELQAGRFFDPGEERSGAKVAVLGPSVSRALYGDDPAAALDRSLRLNHSTFRVIGVTESFGADNDNVIIMPQRAARSRVLGNGYNGDELSSIIAKADSTQDVASAVRQITTALRAEHSINNSRYDDFEVRDLGSRLTEFTSVLNLLTGLAPIIASISLVVGGFGLLNIMLISVAARTREIGIRKAVGATRQAVLVQFGLEATALAGIGGVAGVLVGIGFVLLVRAIIPMLGPSGFFMTLRPQLTTGPIVTAFLISLAVGVLAGLYPAWRASRVAPVDALAAE